MGLWAAFSFLFFTDMTTSSLEDAWPLSSISTNHLACFVYFTWRLHLSLWGGGGVLSIVPDFARHKDSRGSKLVFEIGSCTDHIE